MQLLLEKCIVIQENVFFWRIPPGVDRLFHIKVKRVCLSLFGSSTKKWQGIRLMLHNEDNNGKAISPEKSALSIRREPILRVMLSHLSHSRGELTKILSEAYAIQTSITLLDLNRDLGTGISLSIPLGHWAPSIIDRNIIIKPEKNYKKMIIYVWAMLYQSYQ